MRFKKKWGHVGQHALGWAKIYEKTFFLIEQVKIEMRNDYVKHQFPSFNVTHIKSPIKMSKAQCTKKT